MWLFVRGKKIDSGRRFCRVLQQLEKTPGHGDTPGFECTKKARITHDPRGFLKLEMPRNNRRVLQTSLYLAMAWRANVDFQVLLIDGSDGIVCMRDIARLTDYIVSYMCKGNESQIQEKKQMANLIMSATANTCDMKDVKRIAHRVLNSVLKERVISRQECLCQLSELPLNLCSERVEHVSISGHVRLGKNNAAKNSLLAMYRDRGKELSNLSLHQFFYFKKDNQKRKGTQEVFPNYTGGRVEMTYPLNASLARSLLLLHKPWKNFFPSRGKTNDQIIQECKVFLESKYCPSSVKYMYEKEKTRFEEGRKYAETTSKEDNDNNYHETAAKYDSDIVDVVQNLSTIVGPLLGNKSLSEYDLGHQHNWSLPSIELEIQKDKHKIAKWLEKQISDHETKNVNQTDLQLPLRTDGNPYRIEDCFSDQYAIIHRVCSHLENNVLLKTNTMKPQLLMTVRGKAGTGKSVMINTLTTTVRKIFQFNGSVIICGPTGCAAFGAGGTTCHRFFGINTSCLNVDPSRTTAKLLLERLRYPVLLIVDERSMLEAKIVGLMEKRCRTYAYGGQCKNLPWGGIPVVLFVGDDFQLPSIKAGAFQCATEESSNRITRKYERPEERALIQHGFNCFQELGKENMKLDIPKRVLSDQKELTSILEACRGEDRNEIFTSADLERLSQLNLRNLNYSSNDKKQLHGDALALFATKEPRDEYNDDMLLRESRENNVPVAFIRADTQNHKGRKVTNARHYDPDRTPASVKLCIGAPAMLTGWNPIPEWGLFHGSIGMVKDIVFEDGKSPNHYDLPLYIMCDFPQYCGPSISPEHPKLVPIPTFQTRCNELSCNCQRKYVPLSLAFAKTVHTFQGANVGPTHPGQPPNAVKRIIVYPGPRSFEGKNPGLLYTIISRVTTMGNPQDKFSSAIYFDGMDATTERYINITLGANGKQYAKVTDRKNWIQYLDKHCTQREEIPEHKRFTTDWINKKQLDLQQTKNLLDFKILQWKTLSVP